MTTVNGNNNIHTASTRGGGRRRRRTSSVLLNVTIHIAISLLISIALKTGLSAASRNEILGSSLQDLVNVNDQELALFLAQEESNDETNEEENSNGGGDRELLRNNANGRRRSALNEPNRYFGQKCVSPSNSKENQQHKQCVQGLDCEDVNFGNRCLPNSCIEQFSDEINEVFGNATQFKQEIYQEAGYSEEQILDKLAEVRNERKFLETDEFKSLEKALLNNLEAMMTVQRIRHECVDPVIDWENDNDNGGEGGRDRIEPKQGAVQYVGMHIEAGAILDASIQYIVAMNDLADQVSILRLCLGAEIGAGAEIAYMFGFTSTDATRRLLCGSAQADVDIALLATAGAAVGIGFNGLFYYEFTFGGGLGAGIGASLCTSLMYGNATIINSTHIS